MKNLFLILIILSLVCCKKYNSTDNNSDNSAKIASDTLKDNDVKGVLTLLKNKDFKKLAIHIHPTDGLRFSPYGFIDIDKDKLFSKSEFLDISKSSKSIVWGNYDGSGEEIKLSFKDYYTKLIYDADFLFAEKLSYNRTIGKGNSKNNISEVYKDCVYSESYFHGFDPKLEGADWTSLKLVFKRFKNNYFLVGIVHDQRTI